MCYLAKIMKILKTIIKKLYFRMGVMLKKVLNKMLLHNPLELIFDMRKFIWSSLKKRLKALLYMIGTSFKENVC